MGGSAGPAPIARRRDRVCPALPPVQQSAAAALAAEFLQAHVTPELQAAAAAEEKAAEQARKAAEMDAELAREDRNAAWHRLLLAIGVMTMRKVPADMGHRWASAVHAYAASGHRLAAAHHRTAAASLRMAATALRLGLAAPTAALRSRAAAAEAAAAACDAAADECHVAAVGQEAAAERRTVLSEQRLAEAVAGRARGQTWRYVLPRLVARFMYLLVWNMVSMEGGAWLLRQAGAGQYAEGRVSWWFVLFNLVAATFVSSF
ncbi:hypothetical protein HYH02_000036 [Chlamydomonas schloesseri]|uniref:Uncharacterized protein n=1 Tax=Chlamydomonas schloesseri TaxID=2026947 RepID=A0A836B7G1_9CHLO|nr:hypothetical protein HYH02_000036 [Chlamydomonas schloesseri]|eukprot:KAG2449932.1 hypothetical protein HYH02_000036 [Chlamydomonas schloesseri]